ncbi:MAG: hypothetical protein KF761_12720 [Salinibacterium sp.]|nr:hypothetical protein [Salinibacterium sp.]
MKHIHALALPFILVGALAACVPVVPESTATASATPSPTATIASPTPTPTPTVEPLSIPDCLTLLPLAVARDNFSASTELLGEPAASDFQGREDVATIRVVLSNASSSRVCYWGVPNSDGLFFVTVAFINPGQRAALESDLAAAGYAQTTTGTVTAYELDGMNEVSSLGFTHLFTGDAWIHVDGSSIAFSGVIAAQVLDAMRAANPTLGL